MAKAKVIEEVPDAVEAAHVPEALPEGHVRCVLKDENERGINHEFTIHVQDRDRVYHMPDGAYTHSRIDADGAFVYRKMTH